MKRVTSETTRTRNSITQRDIMRERRTVIKQMTLVSHHLIETTPEWDKLIVLRGIEDERSIANRLNKEEVQSDQYNMYHLVSQF